MQNRISDPDWFGGCPQTFTTLTIVFTHIILITNAYMNGYFIFPLYISLLE